MEVFQGSWQEPLKVKVLERLAMCQNWNETSGQDCSGYLREGFKKKSGIFTKGVGGSATADFPQKKKKKKKRLKTLDFA